VVLVLPWRSHDCLSTQSHEARRSARK